MSSENTDKIGEKQHQRILHIAVPTPLHSNFDYLPAKDTPEHLTAGIRIRVPFGHKKVIGILLEERHHTEVKTSKLKTILETLDTEPVLSNDLLRLAHWANQYYHYPMGQILSAMLPSLLRKGSPETLVTEKIWIASAKDTKTTLDQLSGAPKQQALLKHLNENPQGLDTEQLNAIFKNWRTPMQALHSKALVEYKNTLPDQQNGGSQSRQSLTLNENQQKALDTILMSADCFNTWLLEGVTGSGKTEVYLQLIDQTIKEHKQALILVPEIGLTPQLLNRFRSRFATEIISVHSGLTSKQRLNAWVAAKSARAKIIIGTRSAIFIPLAKPGLIIIDEEHDGSFKQQDGFRYNARDLAIVRAHQLNTPIVLGSATPCLETLHNALTGRYQHLKLPKRAGEAQLPRLAVVDARQTPAGQPLTRQFVERMRYHLQQKKQVLIFLNRRGFAPVLCCTQCGWMAQCTRCDAYLTLHKTDQNLRCHHCAYERIADRQCPNCGHANLQSLGRGTEQIENFVNNTFPDHQTVRIDRDATRHKGSLEKHLEQVHTGKAQILIGTQMLSKGHHFPSVTLVGILDIDQGLFSADFRGPEYMAQLITQVAGRAGRGDSTGEVLIETYQPEHPLLHLLITSGYNAFSTTVLQERMAAQLPPYSKLALIRAEAVTSNQALDFLQSISQLLSQTKSTGLEILGPIPAPMEKRAGRYRAQLLLQATERRILHATVANIRTMTADNALSRRVRWSIDIDPSEML